MTATPDVIVLRYGNAQLHILPYGLHLHRLVLDGTHDFLAGPEDAQDLIRERSFRNSIVGRYTSRLPHKAIQLPNGSTFTPQAANPSDPIVLHSGPEGFDVRVWQRIDRSATTLFSEGDKEVRTGSREDEALFLLESPENDQGFPGAVRFEALFKLQKNAKYDCIELLIAYRAALTSSHAPGDGFATPVNLTQHTGYLLSTDDDISQHKLWIKAQHHSLLDVETQLATGLIQPVSKAKVPMDLTRVGGASLGSCLSHDMDYNYLLDQHTDDEVIATLHHPTAPYYLSFRTNQGALQVWSANSWSKDQGGSKKRLHRSHLSSQGGYVKHGAIFLEFQAPSGTVLMPNGPLAKLYSGDTLLRPGSVYDAWHACLLLPRNK